MQDSYTRNYVKIYFWQGLSLILNFLSMFIVVPYLTSEPSTYGIYTVCVSISIFLSYADLGFMGAGQKYAAESFARSERSEEIKVIGFTNFILLLILILFSVVFLILSFHPEQLIKGLTTLDQKSIASSLLLIMALFTPVTFLQRLLQMIFGIRLEDYIVQRINIVANILKIFSVLFFFRNGEYYIVWYFLFVQIVNLLAALFAIFIAKKRYNYDFYTLVKSIHFNKRVYTKTKKLAFTSLYLTFTWILYYELDPAVIGKFIGAKQVAVYAIGLTVLSFYRSILGILFSPFSARFNHFVGLNNEEGLKSIYFKVIILSAPIVIIPIVTINLLASPLILAWVGSNYSDSIIIMKFLVFCNIFAFITYPTGILLMAKEKVWEMYLINTIIPFAYWSGIILLYSILGLESFAIFKLVAFGTSAIGYSIIMIKYLRIDILNLIREFIFPVIGPIVFLIGSTYFLIAYLPVEQSKTNLLIVASTAIGLMTFSFAIYFLASSKGRSSFKSLLSILIS